MRNLYVTVRGPISFTDEEWARIERLAARANVTPIKYLQDEPSTHMWWEEFAAGNVNIEIEEP